MGSYWALAMAEWWGNVSALVVVLEVAMGPSDDRLVAGRGDVRE